MQKIFDKIKQTAVIPVAVIEDASKAVSIASALADGDLDVIEVTMRTDAALQAIKNITSETNVLVGAGTVLSTKQVDDALSAGAKFIVSPNLDSEVVTYCISKDVPVIPGISTCSEAQSAAKLGLTKLKFFPAELSGGVKMLKTLNSVYPELSFMPTGGLNIDNFKDYLALPNVYACGGSFMLKKEYMDNNDFKSITNVCNEIIRKLYDFHLLHIGINGKDEDDAVNIGKSFAKLFGMSTEDKGAAIYCNNDVEILKSFLCGEHGHLGFETWDIERAIHYFESKDIEFNYDSLVSDNKGPLAIYFKEEIAGYAIHLRRRLDA